MAMRIASDLLGCTPSRTKSSNIARYGSESHKFTIRILGIQTPPRILDVFSILDSHVKHFLSHQKSVWQCSKRKKQFLGEL